MHRSACSQLWRMERRSFSSFSAESPGQPIQMPPFFCSSGSIAVASPPELRSVTQPRSVFRSVSGRRLETTIRRFSMCNCGSTTFAVLEEFDLPQTLLGCRFALVWAAQVFALLGKHFVSCFHFFDHARTPIFGKPTIKSMNETLYD